MICFLHGFEFYEAGSRATSIHSSMHRSVSYRCFASGVFYSSLQTHRASRKVRSILFVAIRTGRWNDYLAFGRHRTHYSWINADLACYIRSGFNVLVEDSKAGKEKRFGVVRKK